MTTRRAHRGCTLWAHLRLQDTLLLQVLLQVIAAGVGLVLMARVLLVATVEATTRVLSDLHTADTVDLPLVAMAEADLHQASGDINKNSEVSLRQ